MSRDFNKHIAQLRKRRTGGNLSRTITLDEARLDSVMAKVAALEAWERRGAHKTATSYVLGSMQEVGPAYTEIAKQTARNVAVQLESELAKRQIKAVFHLQGSVPLNVHIRDVSDVDLLTIDPAIVMISMTGVKARSSHYPSTDRTGLEVLQELRRAVEAVPASAYRAGKVDLTGSKAVKISGGSLPMPVDVVPAMWFDTDEYQRTNKTNDRGVYILDKKAAEKVKNHPFLHIDRVIARCDQAKGGLRKAVRLCKSVKAEAESDGKSIPLPSFDITSIFYHADLKALAVGQIFELGILAEAQRHVEALTKNRAATEKLLVPDGSRPIINTAEKWTGLVNLSLELDDLVREIAQEHADPRTWRSSAPLSESRAILNAAYIGE